MPAAAEILNGLSRIANDWQVLAIFWHGYLGIFLVGLAIGFRPSVRLTGILLGLLLLSVSVLAWLGSNPFNGIFFAVTSVASILATLRLSRPVQKGPPWAVLTGVTIVVCGWIYPHFLKTSSFLTYLYSAPTGLVPCPTLSIVVGSGLILSSLESKKWGSVIGVAGLFYGLFGAIRLSVVIDWVLVVGSVSLVYDVFRRELTD